jgi:hypothetical protein
MHPWLPSFGDSHLEHEDLFAAGTVSVDLSQEPSIENEDGWGEDSWRKFDLKSLLSCLLTPEDELFLRQLDILAADKRIVAVQVWVNSCLYIRVYIPRLAALEDARRRQLLQDLFRRISLSPLNWEAKRDESACQRLLTCQAVSTHPASPSHVY